jgi:hypothetical protein
LINKLPRKRTRSGLPKALVFSPPGNTTLLFSVLRCVLFLVDDNWDKFFALDSKSTDLPAPKVTPNRNSNASSSTNVAATRKPTPISPSHRRRSNLRDYMGNHTNTPPTADDDDWDKDFEGGFNLHSPPQSSSSAAGTTTAAATHHGTVPLPPLPPLSPKKTLSSPRKLSPPKSSTGHVSDDNSKTIRPAPASRTAQSRQVSAESNASSSSNTVRAVNVSSLPPPLPTSRAKSIPKAPSVLKKRSKSRSKSVTRGESSDDGYEDLVKGDESKFAMKVNSLKVTDLPNTRLFLSFSCLTSCSEIFRLHRDYCIPRISNRCHDHQLRSPALNRIFTLPYLRPRQHINSIIP